MIILLSTIIVMLSYHYAIQAPEQATANKHQCISRSTMIERV